MEKNKNDLKNLLNKPQDGLASLICNIDNFGTDEPIKNPEALNILSMFGIKVKHKNKIVQSFLGDFLSHPELIYTKSDYMTKKEIAKVLMDNSLAENLEQGLEYTQKLIEKTNEYGGNPLGKFKFFKEGQRNGEDLYVLKHEPDYSLYT